MRLISGIDALSCRRGVAASRVWCLSACALLSAAGVAAAATPAGTPITNIARVDYRLDGANLSTRSNRVDILVGEIIDFTVSPAPACATSSANGVLVIAFDITNLGNGHEAFIPGTPIAIDAPDFVLTGVFADTDGSGCYEAGIDQKIPSGGKTAQVAPGGRIRIFVVGTGTAGTGRITLPVSSETGAGGTGTAAVGGGDNGGDAVIVRPGGTTGEASTPLPAALTAKLVKSQSVRSADGGAQPSRDAIVTYTIKASFVGTGTARSAAIEDAIPAGTSYVAGSLSMDGARLSDAGGDDAGDFNGQRIAVSLGDVAAPATRSISFQVRIK